MASALKAAVFYTPSEIVKFFHSVPHYDLSFNKVSSDFRPNYQPYQEVSLSSSTHCATIISLKWRIGHVTIINVSPDYSLPE